jgi:hypothetical protein
MFNSYFVDFILRQGPILFSCYLIFSSALFKGRAVYYSHYIGGSRVRAERHSEYLVGIGSIDTAWACKGLQVMYSNS